MADFINVIPLDLPGRGGRFNDSLLSDMDSMVDDVFSQVKDDLYTPCAIYGHSLGALLGYLLIKRIIKEDLPVPLYAFFSGREAPTVPEKDHFHKLPKAEFIKKIESYEGTPDSVLENKDLIELVEPILRADFKAIETYSHKVESPFDVPIMVMIGLEEDVNYDDALKWQDETTKKIIIKQFPGKHFFIFDHAAQVCRLFSKTLNELLASTNKLVGC